jgi:hypothetical protein
VSDRIELRISMEALVPKAEDAAKQDATKK